MLKDSWLVIPMPTQAERFQPPGVGAFNLLEEEIAHTASDQLRGKKLPASREMLAKADNPRPGSASCLDELLPEAFAVVREAGKRVPGA